MNWFHYIIGYLSLLIIDPSVPSDRSIDWLGKPQWEKLESYWQLTASSETLPEKCRQNPELYLSAPVIIQGVHNFYMDDRLVFSSGHPEAKYAGNMNSPALVSCRYFSTGKTLKYLAIATTGSYAKIAFWPRLVTYDAWRVIFSETMPVATAGILAMLGFVCFVLFRGKGVTKRLILAFTFSCMFTAGHFALTTPEFWGIRISPYNLHRLHDVLLWIGTIFIYYTYFVNKIINTFIFKLQLVLAPFAVFIILSAPDLNHAQVGSTIAFIGNVFALLYMMSNLLFSSIANRTLTKEWMRVSSVAVFVITGVMDLCTHANLWHLPAVYPLGMMASMIFVALLVNADIQVTYRERDDLRANLERKVAEKTEQLALRAADLEVAYRDLSAARADSIQSAKLASLGTLSAGIAHEINNSLNYVCGAIDPLRTLISKEAFTEQDRKKGERLLGLMKEGLDLTTQIIASLKRYAAKGSEELELLSFNETLATVLTILKSKLVGKAEIVLKVPEKFLVRASKVGLSQILMNLISNAVDALDGSNTVSPRITITAEEFVAYWQITVSDNGPGIPTDIKERIFEPFFTTKQVGKGTGLGLHIVHTEMQRAGGSVQVLSTISQGTEFLLKFPKDSAEPISVQDSKDAA